MNYIEKVNFDIALENAIGLSDRQKRIIKLLLEGYDLREIADMDKCHYNTIKNQFNKAKNVLSFCPDVVI